MNDPEIGRLTGVRSFFDFLAEKLSRVTSSGEMIPEVDGLRFIAISAVIFHHMMSICLPAGGRTGKVHTTADWFAAANEYSPLIKIFYSGHFGVNLFFAISGFILALPFARRSFNNQPRPNLKSYYLRRVTRIEPPYAICLILFFISLAQYHDNALELFPHLLASLLYSHGLIYGQHSLINGVAWSLEIEIQFYLLVPWLVSIFKIRSARWRRGLLISLIIFGGWFSQYVIYPAGSSRLPLTLLNFFHYFLVGFLVADLYLTGWLRQEKKSLLFDLLTAASAVAIVMVLVRYGRYYFSLPLLVATLYVGCFRGLLSNAFVRLRWIVIIGGMCYTFYLYHIAIVSLMSWNIDWLFSTARPVMADFLIQSLVVCPAIFALCSLWFVFTEKPFMRWSLSPRPIPQVSAAD